MSRALSFPFSPTSPQQKRREPSGSNSARVGPQILTKQCHQTLKRMTTLHEFGLPRDIIISPPHSFFRCLSEYFMSFLQKDKVNLFFSTPRKDRSPFTKVIYAPYIQWEQFTSVQYHLGAISEKKVRLKKLIRTKNKTKREEWNMYIMKRTMNLWTEYVKEKTEYLQITVSISKEKHITYKLNNILLTVQKAERSINKYQSIHKYLTSKTT